MNSSRSRSLWKEALILFLVVLLVVALVWLFLRPTQPGRQIVFGDLGPKAAPKNIPPEAPAPSLPPPEIPRAARNRNANTSTNSNTNAMVAATPPRSAVPQTNAMASATNDETPQMNDNPALARKRAQRDAIFGAIARNASNSLVGRYVAVTNVEAGGAGTNTTEAGPISPMSMPHLTNTLAAAEALQRGMQPDPAQDPAQPQSAMTPQSNPSETTPAMRPARLAPAAPRSPAPVPVYSSGSGSQPKYIPEAVEPPPEPVNKSSTSTLMAQARADGTKAGNSEPLRTPELLGTSVPPLLFDTRIGTNVVFLLDNSMDMMTHGKSAEARKQLEHSLESMDPMHSFYVLFFHTGGFEGMPALGPMPALPENVNAMTNWLFTAGHRSGADPSNAIQRALALVPAPDVIWILAGSPVPQTSLDAIRNANASLHARIFTIGFQTREPEDVLRQIANENRGDYHFIPPPDSP